MATLASSGDAPQTSLSVQVEPTLPCGSPRRERPRQRKCGRDVPGAGRNQFWELRPGAAVTVAERFTGELRERGGQADDPRTDHRRQQRSEGGAMTILAKKRYIGALALAVASVTALAACSSSSASVTPGATKVPGGIGGIPAAGT